MSRAKVKVKTLSTPKISELRDAKNAEVNRWLKNKVVVAVSRAGLRAADLMRMRWVITRKDDGSLKARLVLQGFTDPRLGHIATASPTASRRARQLFLTMSASLGYMVAKCDVKTAFLQGEGDGDGVLAEPIEELRHAMQLSHAECVRTVKTVYGLVNAPRRWWIKVDRDLTGLGWCALETEPCFWVYRDSAGRVLALAVAHVGDFMISHDPTNP